MKPLQSPFFYVPHRLWRKPHAASHTLEGLTLASAQFETMVDHKALPLLEHRQQTRGLLPEHGLVEERFRRVGVVLVKIEYRKAFLLGLGVEVVLLGTGKRLRFPAPALMRPFAPAGIGLEVMDLQAACRTYNILASAGRKVAAALLFD